MLRSQCAELIQSDKHQHSLWFVVTLLLCTKMEWQQWQDSNEQKKNTHKQKKQIELNVGNARFINDNMMYKRMVAFSVSMQRMKRFFFLGKIHVYARTFTQKNHLKMSK